MSSPIKRSGQGFEFNNLNINDIRKQEEINNTQSERIVEISQQNIPQSSAPPNLPKSIRKFLDNNFINKDHKYLTLCDMRLIIAFILENAQSGLTPGEKADLVMEKFNRLFPDKEIAFKNGADAEAALYLIKAIEWIEPVLTQTYGNLLAELKTLRDSLIQELPHYLHLRTIAQSSSDKGKALQVGMKAITKLTSQGRVMEKKGGSAQEVFIIDESVFKKTNPMAGEQAMLIDALTDLIKPKGVVSLFRFRNLDSQRLGMSQLGYRELHRTFTNEEDPILFTKIIRRLADPNQSELLELIRSYNLAIQDTETKYSYKDGDSWREVTFAALVKDYYKGSHLKHDTPFKGPDGVECELALYLLRHKQFENMVLFDPLMEKVKTIYTIPNLADTAIKEAYEYCEDKKWKFVHPQNEKLIVCHFKELQRYWLKEEIDAETLFISGENENSLSQLSLSELPEYESIILPALEVNWNVVFPEVFYLEGKHWTMYHRIGEVFSKPFVKMDQFSELFANHPFYTNYSLSKLLPQSEEAYLTLEFGYYDLHKDNGGILKTEKIADIEIAQLLSYTYQTVGQQERVSVDFEQLSSDFHNQKIDEQTPIELTQNEKSLITTASLANMPILSYGIEAARQLRYFDSFTFSYNEKRNVDFETLKRDFLNKKIQNESDVTFAKENQQMTKTMGDIYAIAPFALVVQPELVSYLESFCYFYKTNTNEYRAVEFQELCQDFKAALIDPTTTLNLAHKSSWSGTFQEFSKSRLVDEEEYFRKFTYRIGGGDPISYQKFRETYRNKPINPEVTISAVSTDRLNQGMTTLLMFPRVAENLANRQEVRDHEWISSYLFSYKDSKADVKEFVDFNQLKADFEEGSIDVNTQLSLTYKKSWEGAVKDFQELVSLLEGSREINPVEIEYYNSFLYSYRDNYSAEQSSVSFATFQNDYLQGNIDRDTKFTAKLKTLSKITLSNVEWLKRGIEEPDELVLFDSDLTIPESNELHYCINEDDTTRNFTMLPVRSFFFEFSAKDTPLTASFIKKLLSKQADDSAIDHYVNRKDASLRKFLPEDQHELDRLIEERWRREEFSLSQMKKDNKGLATVALLQEKFAHEISQLIGNESLWIHLQGELLKKGTRGWFKPYTVREPDGEDKRETLEDIARYYSITLEELQKLNGGNVSNPPDVGSQLIVRIPLSASAADYPSADLHRRKIAKQLTPRLTSQQFNVLKIRQSQRTEYLRSYQLLKSIECESTLESLQIALGAMRQFVASSSSPISKYNKAKILIPLIENLSSRLRESNSTQQLRSIYNRVRDFLEQLKKDCQPTFFNVAKVMYPLLADVYELNKLLLKDDQQAGQSIGSGTHSLEWSIEEGLKIGPNTELYNRAQYLKNLMESITPAIY